ncbi:MAG: hypothetical protein KatS3mg105_4449 [Gemmatales bacterium]|nr:MAG: hypothetical protein KatS3mg105_4449 [Gemmatales bacterium]
MAIVVLCECGGSFQAPDTPDRGKAKCPKCGTSIAVWQTLSLTNDYHAAAIPKWVWVSGVSVLLIAVTVLMVSWLVLSSASNPTRDVPHQVQEVAVLQQRTSNEVTTGQQPARESSSVPTVQPQYEPIGAPRPVADPQPQPAPEKRPAPKLLAEAIPEPRLLQEPDPKQPDSRPLTLAASQQLDNALLQWAIQKAEETVKKANLQPIRPVFSRIDSKASAPSVVEARLAIGVDSGDGLGQPMCRVLHNWTVDYVWESGKPVRTSRPCVGMFLKLEEPAKIGTEILPGGTYLFRQKNVWTVVSAAGAVAALRAHSKAKPTQGNLLVRDPLYSSVAACVILGKDARTLHESLKRLRDDVFLGTAKKNLLESAIRATAP